ncbi:MAG: type II secretion system minor pseudopilin GspK [Rubrivivax sp.]
MPGQRSGRADGAHRGAALLLAMIVLTLVASVAAGMVWSQERAVRVEAAERARVQGAWMLNGALDWARLILREDLRADRERQRGANPRPLVDGLGETWASPLAEARLSSFLAADQDNSADASLEVFLSGAISDAQARWNLRNLLGTDGKVDAAQLAALRRLVDEAGVPADTADRLAEGLRAAWAPASEEARRAAPLAPERFADLAWLGLDAATLARLEPLVTLLPVRTPVNANTAEPEVLVAAIDGLDLGSAERIVQARRRKSLAALDSLEEIKALLPSNLELRPDRVAVSTSWFEVRGRLRIDDRVLEERSLLQRTDTEVVVRRRERLHAIEGG